MASTPQRPSQGSWTTLGETTTITIEMVVGKDHNGSILAEYGQRQGSEHCRILLTNLCDISQEDWLFFLRKSVMIDITNSDREKKKSATGKNREYLAQRLREKQTKGPKDAPHFDLAVSCAGYHTMTDEEKARKAKEQKELDEILRSSGLSVDELREIVAQMKKGK